MVFMYNQSLLLFDVFESRERALNQKLVLGSLLSLLSVGGTLVNLCIFTVPASLGARILSVSALILIHAPLAFASIACCVGKRELFKKLMNWSFERHEK